MPVNAGTATPTIRLGTTAVSRIHLGSASVYEAGSGTSSPALSVPYQVSALAGNAQAVVQWRAAAGASTGYRIQYSSNGGGTWTTSSATATTTTSGSVITGTATVTGLTNGTEYFFRVARTTSSAVGEYSQPSEPALPLAAADIDPPTGVTAEIFTTAAPQYLDRVILSWTAPTTSLQLLYSVSISQDGGTTWLSPTQISIGTLVDLTDMLTPGVGYVFRVASVVASTFYRHLESGTPVVQSAWSATTSEVTAPLGVPNPPQALMVEPTAGGGYITFSAPLWNGGASITNYKVYVYASGTSRPGTATQTLSSTVFSASVTGLTNGTTYVVDVTAINSEGESAAAVAPPGGLTTLTPQAGIPARLASFSASAGDAGPPHYGGFIPAEVELSFSTTEVEASEDAGEIIEVHYAQLPQYGSDPRFYATTAWTPVGVLSLAESGGSSSQTFGLPFLSGRTYALRARAVKGLIVGPNTYDTVTTATYSPP